MNTEEFLHLYYMESEAISKRININSDEIRDKMPHIYSEDVFKKMIKTDLRELRILETETNIFEDLNIDIGNDESNENVENDENDENVENDENDENIKNVDNDENVEDDKNIENNENNKNDEDNEINESNKSNKNDEYIKDEHIKNEHIKNEHIKNEHIKNKHIKNEHIKNEHDKNIDNDKDVEDNKNIDNDEDVEDNKNIDNDENNKINKNVEDDEHIKNENITLKTKIYIVGDIHGSVIQLFAPLIKAKIIKNLRYDEDFDKFEFDFYKNINPDTRIIYTGDIIYRGIHAHLMAMIEALIIIIQRFNYKIVNWVFGNHDMEFIKYGGIPRYTLNEYKMCCPRFYEIHSMFCEFALKNPYKFGYELNIDLIKNNFKSSDILKDEDKDLSKIDIEIKLTDDIINDIQFNQILITHTIQTDIELRKFIKLYNEIFNTVVLYKDLMSINQMNICFDNIVKLMLKSNDKYFNPTSKYSNLLALTMWNRPPVENSEIKNSKNNYVDFGYRYHFIGHTPIDTFKYIDVFDESDKIKNTIIMTDLNTFNNEYYDDCSWYSLSNFKRFTIKQINKKSSTSDSESEINISYSDDINDYKILLHQIVLENGDDFKFNNFTLTLICNEVKYPNKMLSQNDIENIHKGIKIYNDLIKD
jgi:hypothetical protein